MRYEWKRGEDWPVQKTYKELGRSSFLQLGITASSQAHWMGLFSFGMLCEIICVNIVPSATYSPNGERWLSMWDVVDDLAQQSRRHLKSNDRSRRSHCCPVANPMHRGHTEAESIYRTYSLADWSRKLNPAMTSIHSPCRPIARHECRVTYVCFSQDGKQILSVPQDNAVRVWDPITAQPLSPPFSGHTH